MLQPIYTKQFKKDVKKIKRSGTKDIEKLKVAVKFLVDEKKLDATYREHNLKGNFKDRREYHIEPDWLLVYKINEKGKTIVFERTGSHADIFE